MDLAYNGLMLGAACHDGEPGNREIRNRPNNDQHAIVMYLEHLDPIVCFSTENRVDHFPLGATNGGYSDNTIVQSKSGGAKRAAVKGDTLSTVNIIQVAQGGDIRWRLARVTSPEAGTAFAIGPIVGTTDRIMRTGLNSAWTKEWARSGGAGAVPDSFVQYPTIWFQQPIDPTDAALKWKIGDRIAFLVDNNAEDDGASSQDAGTADGPKAPPYGNCRYSSVNAAYRKERPDIDRSTYLYQRNVGLWWAKYSHRTEYYPPLLIGHQRPGGPMIVKGNSYIGLANSGEVTLAPGESIRQVIKIPNDPLWAGREIIAADASLWRGNSSSGSLTLELRKAGSSVGGATDNGTLIDDVTIPASDLLDVQSSSGFDIKVLPSTLLPSGVNTDKLDPHRRLTLASPVAVQPGQAYYVTFVNPSGNSAKFVLSRVLNQFRATQGLVHPDYEDLTCVYQRRSGSGSWSTETNSSGWYVHLGVGLHFNA